MNLNAFFGVVSTVDFALLGLWWVTVQTRPDLRKHGSVAARMSYMVSLQFVVPGTASLLAEVDPAVTLVWRVSFAIAGATGILAIVFLVPALAASSARLMANFLRFGAVPLYAAMTIIAVTPGFLLSNSSGTLGSLQVEGILFCLVVLLSAQVAWAGAMSIKEPAEQAGQADPGTRADPGTGHQPGSPVPPPPGPVSGPPHTRLDVGAPHGYQPAPDGYGYQPASGGWGSGPAPSGWGSAPTPDPRYPERGNPAGK